MINLLPYQKKLSEILRDDLSFTGVIMTDDLAMDAITMYSDDPYIETVNAGNDLLITTDYEKTYNSIINGINNGSINMDTIDNSVVRIIAWKYKLGLEV